MFELAESALRVSEILAAKAARGTLNEFEMMLYEASSRFAATILNFHDACSQSALIKAERELDGLQKERSAS
jgi:hypothetical protein